jgi:hypothetical protein
MTFVAIFRTFLRILYAIIPTTDPYHCVLERCILQSINISITKLPIVVIRIFSSFYSPFACLS